MTIVLNENEWAERMISTRTLGKDAFETLTRVARYYIDKNYGVKNVKVKLNNFVLECDPSASLSKWSDIIDFAIKKATKTPALDVEYIEITDVEIAKIEELKGTRLRRLAFALLCLGKYWMIKRPTGDGWVSNEDTEIMRLANINTSVKNRCELLSNLKDLGYIDFSKKVDNTNIKINYIQEGEPVLKVYDFRNLGYQYLSYKNEPFYTCSNCGLVTRLKTPNKGRPPKYCEQCAEEIKSMQMLDAMRRYREKNNDDFKKCCKML